MWRKFEEKSGGPSKLLLVAQAETLTKIHHKNIVSLIGYCKDGGHMALVYEYMSGGTLEHKLRGALLHLFFKKKRSYSICSSILNFPLKLFFWWTSSGSDDGSTGSLTWKQRLRIALDSAQGHRCLVHSRYRSCNIASCSCGRCLTIDPHVLAGLEYLHKSCTKRLIHRDVKTSNILLNDNLEAKIADFGLLKAFHRDEDTHVSRTRVVGTLGYFAPEYTCFTPPVPSNELFPTPSIPNYKSFQDS